MLNLVKYFGVVCFYVHVNGLV